MHPCKLLFEGAGQDACSGEDPSEGPRQPSPHRLRSLQVSPQSGKCFFKNIFFHLFLLKEVLDEPQVKTLLYLADLLEMCQFKVFWQQIHAQVN